MSFTSARRDARFVIAAKAVSWFGDEVALVALTLRLQGNGAGAGAVSALLVANLLPIVLLSGVVGRLLDRHDNRRLLLASGIGQTAVCAVLAFTTPTWAVLGLVAALGVGQSVNGATWQALLVTIVGRDGLPAASGLMTAAVTSAGIVAPPVGGLLTGWYGARVPLLVDAATFLLIVLAAFAIRTRRAPVALAVGERARGGFHIVWQDELLRPAFVLLGVLLLLASMVNVMEVFLVRETLGASAIWYGAAGAALSLGALGGALGAGRLRGAPRLARGFVLSAAVLAVSLAGMGAVPAVGWLLPLGVVLGLGNGVLNVTLNALVMGRARDDERGRVGAVLYGVASGTQICAFLMSGLLAEVLDPREIFVAAGGLALLAPLAVGRRLVRAADASLGPVAGSGAACRPAARPTPSRGCPQIADGRSGKPSSRRKLRRCENASAASSTTSAVSPAVTSSSVASAGHSATTRSAADT